jgi:uncharacterized OB-fold protein
MADHPPPVTPATDADSAPYWEALRAHRLPLRTCVACTRGRIVPTPSCPYCGHPEHVPGSSAGLGAIYSFVTMHRAFDPAFQHQVPYSIATVDLDDGARALGRVTGPTTIGARVEPEFFDHDGWTELRFRVASQP